MIFLIPIVCLLFFLFPKVLICFVFLLLALVGVTWIGAISLTKNTALKIDYEGISLPLIFLFSMKGELDRDWSELKEIAFFRGDLPSYDPDTLIFVFRGKAYVKFAIDGFTRSDFERLLLAVNTYCPGVKRRPELDDLSSNIYLPSPGSSSGPLSFTDLWQTELSMRFGSTAFVPHESGDRLQDGAVKILGQVAFGGLSAIYLADWQNKTVILKEAVLPESIDDEARKKYLDLFDREALMLSKINHPRIAAVYDSFVEDNRHYLLLEYIEGRNLREYIKQFGPQPEKTVAIWADEIGDILVYLHELSPPVIHRDLTPDNLIVSRDGGITVIDFGAANDFLGTATGTVVGKNAYIPLEQFRGKASPQSDLYAFGATVYFLLTGRDPIPFSQSSPVHDGFDVSPELDRLIKECTAMEKQDRIKSAKALSSRLKQLVKNVS